MKKMRKLLALLVALVMTFAMASTTFAADAVNYTITAPSNGHTYEIYQIFTGDLSDGKLSNVEAGSNYKGSDAAADAAKLAASTATTDAGKLAEIKTLVDLTGTPAYTVASGASVSVPAGYYLIKDVDGSLQDADDAYTLYLAKIVGDTTIDPKTGKPTLVKKVQDINDSTGATTDWQDSADYDIGDEIPYQLTATMGDLSAYSTYYVEFTDTMSAGLTYKEITSVKVGDTTLAADKYTATWDNQVLTVSINNVMAYGATTGTKVVVEYTATLNEKAVIGSAGNPNTAYLTYSNNPNNSGDGTSKPSDTGKTPEDKNIVFTYKVNANKVDENKKALVGASFKLEKLDAEGNVIKDLGTIDGTNASTFEWKGIDDGIYKITETVTPAGYNTIDPQTFTVTAEHDALADDPTLTKLSGNAATGSVIKLSADIATGSVSTDIENKSGSTLPTTGGMGTTMFYAVGIVLVLGAGILLVTRRRMAK